MSDPILGFNSEWHPFSNFHREPDGTCVEIEFQAQKTMLPSERSRILTAGSPGKAKRCGKDKSLTTLRPDWEDIKIDRMHMLVETKFCTWKELAALLLSSGDRELVETNNWGDDFWGQVWNPKTKQWEGENMLGQILMSIRKDISRARAQARRKKAATIP
jgi:ribA/ribD-fused uncharacterized protein